jgi:hypothetical protein
MAINKPAGSKETDPNKAKRRPWAGNPKHEAEDAKQAFLRVRFEKTKPISLVTK